MAIEEGIRYRYKKHPSQTYEVLFICKSKIGDDWVPGVVYKDTTGNVYVRPLDQFEEKFEVLP